MTVKTNTIALRFLFTELGELNPSTMINDPIKKNKKTLILRLGVKLKSF